MQLFYTLLIFLFTVFSMDISNELVPVVSEDEPKERTVRIIGVNKMKFVVNENRPGVVVGDTVTTVDGKSFLELEAIKVKPGARLTLELTTKSKLPGRSMSHNWVLLKPQADPAEFDKEAVLAVDNDYIPPHKEDEIMAATSLAGPGETVSVTFTAPDRQGMYDYLCSFPGHFANDMRGKLIVQK